MQRKYASVDNPNYKHGGKGEKLYVAWCSMRARCNSPKHKSYGRYGGRGITICKEWDDYSAFREWAYENGYRHGLSLDRIDNNKGYYPENCRYVTQKIQGNNQRNNVRIRVGDVEKTLHEWADFLGIKSNTLYYRIVKLGWSASEALFYKPNSPNLALKGEEGK